MLSNLKVNAIKAVTKLQLHLNEHPWLFAVQNRQRIDQHWANLSANNPAVWNGTILMARDISVSDATFYGSFFESDFASFVAWRDWDWPDTDVFNCFGSAVIHSNDGALIYGKMQHNTLNPGLCYPPGGSLDLSDLRGDGAIDMMGSIKRELAEETGLDADNAEDFGLTAVFDEQRISIAQRLAFDSSADDLVDQIRGYLAVQDNPELSDVIVLRSNHDPTDLIPGYARQLACSLLPD